MQTFVTDFFEQVDPLTRVWLGKVEDNNDPKKLGRVKVRIPLYGDIPKEDIPWATRFGSFATGATNSAFSFSVPDVGSLVVVAFLNKDIYFPFYFASPTNDLTDVSEWLSGYPDAYGYKDKKGNKIIVNEQAGTILLHHFSGTQVQIEDSGTVNITEVKDRNEEISDNLNVNIGANCNINVGGNCNVSCGGTCNITATKINLN